MKSVSTCICWGGALLTILAVLIAPLVYADDSNPIDPPSARIRPPGGFAAEGQIRILPPGGSTEQAGRILPPGGVTAQQRIGPPGGIAAQPESPSLMDRLWEWLGARIGPPIG